MFQQGIGQFQEFQGHGGPGFMPQGQGLSQGHGPGLMLHGQGQSLQQGPPPRFFPPGQQPGNRPGALAEAAKIMQGKSQAFNALWVDYCTSSGAKVDPHTHDANALSSFVDQVCIRAIGNTFGNETAHAVVSGPSMAMGMSGGHPAKRMKTVERSGDRVKDHLVDRIKAYQTSAPSNKDMWHKYVEQFLNGWRDPSKQASEDLYKFCEMCAVPDVPEGGRVDPNLLQMDPEKRQLCERIKSFQKADPARKEMWYTFCGQTKDPYRHEIPALQEFCTTFAVP